MNPGPVPSFVVSDEDRQRWKLAEAVATRVFGEEDAAGVWQATRILFHSDIPTGDFDGDHSESGWPR